LRKFATAVLAVKPSATGPAISYYELTVTGAFVEAGILALASIAVLLFITLRMRYRRIGAKFREYHRASLTLLLGIGVAFKIYVAGRTHRTAAVGAYARDRLQSDGECRRIRTMWGSTYPGMSSMGKLMVLSLTSLHDGIRSALSTGSDSTSARAGVLIAGTGTRSGGGGVVVRLLKETVSVLAIFFAFSEGPTARPPEILRSATPAIVVSSP
jgi:uncharacterized membrane protein YgcG